MSDREIANTILSQLGGSRFVAMTGAKNFVAIEKGLQASIGRGAKNKANKVRITLTPADLYDVEFYRFSSRTFDCPSVGKVEGVDAESLARVFTNATGLDTRL